MNDLDPAEPLAREEPLDAEHSELFERHRRELVAHCYRMTGSFVDAEELTQETFLRAWRSRHRFEGRSGARTWLYRIATNACLDHLKSHARRTRSHDSVAEILETETDLTPHPEHEDPAELVARRETTSLEVMAALLDLPPRQRAVLIARDLIEMSAEETAAILDCSLASVNSLLQRARAHTRRLGTNGALLRSPPDDESTARLVNAYLAVYDRGDVEAITRLFTDDARLSMPPERSCVGRRSVEEFYAYLLEPSSVGYWRLLPARANGAPALANYVSPSPQGVYSALSIDVLFVEDGRIAGIHSFLGSECFPSFGLPLAL